MFGFMKKMFIIAMNAILLTLVGCVALNAVILKFVSVNN